MGKKRGFRLDIGYFIKEGVTAIFAHGFMSFAAVCMIVACLLIMGSFSLVAVNMDKMLGDLEAENEFLAYIDEDYSEEEALAVENLLRSVVNVASTQFVSREEAMETYKSNQESNVLLDELPAEVLRDRYRIRVVDIEMMASTVEEVEKLEGVVHISVALDIANGFVMIRNIANIVATVLIVVLILVSLFIMSNTIKLATFYRREEISIMKMCGATNGFVRAPFIVEGLVLGTTGAVVAYILQWVCYQMVFNLVEESAGVGLLDLLPYSDMSADIFKTFMIAGFTIGVGGSLLAIRKFLQA